MASKKKFATAAVATTLAASLLLGGTFAWQSISQTALNEKEAVINPGGRLHDDFDGTNKDVYVENFAENDIYARIRLDEYFEIIMNKGTAAEKVEQIVGTDKDDTSTYETHLFDTKNDTDAWWNWTTGGSTTYMPTFNMNKDSLVADINGTMDYKDSEGNADPYGDYVDYSKEENKTKTATEIYDGDSNSVDEVGTDFEHLVTYVTDGNVITKDAEHTAKATGTATLISMEDWLALGENEETGNYWVYDTDGWVYYSSPIEAGKATGLLLNEIGLTGVMDDSYYYAINVVAQFITADDLGKDDNTGFYADGETVSENALTLLEKIGVTVSQTTDGAGGSNSGGNVVAGRYSISFGTEKNIAILNSDASNELTLSLSDGENTVTEGVTYTLSTTNATVTDGTLVANEPTMSNALDKHTITASVNGETVATADFYMSDATKHGYGTTYSGIDSTTEEQSGDIIYIDEDGNVWICFVLPTVITSATGGANYTICVWQYGDDVTNISRFGVSGTATWKTYLEKAAELLNSDETLENGVSYRIGESTINRLSYMGKCTHIVSES